MADRNVIINIQDVIPKANTAYVDPNVDNKTYNKEQINLKISDSQEGIKQTAITPNTALATLNSLENGIYRASGAGTYKFSPSIVIVDGQSNNIIPDGYDVKFVKSSSGWAMHTVLKLPAQDLTPLNNRITEVEVKVDDFIENFAVEIDQEFNKNSLNAPSARAINNVVFGNVGFNKTDITSSATLLSNRVVNPVTFAISTDNAWDVLKIPINAGELIEYTTTSGASTGGQNVIFQANSNDVITSAIGYKNSVINVEETVRATATSNGYLYFNKRKNITNIISVIKKLIPNGNTDVPNITEPSLWEEVYKNYALRSDSLSKTKFFTASDLLKNYMYSSNRLINSSNEIVTGNNNIAWRNIFIYELTQGKEVKANVKLSIYPNSSPAKTLLAIKKDGSIVSLLDSENEVITPTEREISIPADTLFISITQKTANLSNIFFKINGQKTIVNNNVFNTSIHIEKEKLPIKGNGQFNWNSYSAHQSNIVVDKLGNEYLCIVDENKYINILKKDAITKEWSAYNFQGKSVNPFGQTIDDNHNAYSISIDKNGYILLTGNMHANPCKSVRSVNPYDITSWVVCNYTTANVTYPRFVKDNNEKVYIFWREGSSGAGDTYYCYFDSDTLTYSVKLKLTDGSSVSVNAYEQRIVIDSNNTIHFCYCVRGSGASANTNVGMYYMKSTDGVNWVTEKNVPLTLPITHNTNGNRIFNIEASSGIVNQNGSCVDGNNNFHTVFWQYREYGNTQIVHLWYNGAIWQIEQLTDFDFRIDLTSTGLLGNLSRPQIIYSKSTNKVFAMYRTSEMDESGQIHFIDVDTRDKFSVGNFVLGQMELQYYQDDESLKMIVHDMVLKDGSLTLKSNNTYLLKIDI